MTPVRVPLPDWIAALAASRPFGAGDRRGTANLIDAAARARARLRQDWRFGQPGPPAARRGLQHDSGPARIPARDLVPP